MSKVSCGFLQPLKRDSIVSSQLELRTSKTYTIGTNPRNDIRLKVQTLVPEYSIIKAKNNGLVKFISNSVIDCKINDKPFKGVKYLESGDIISVLGNKFRYENLLLSKRDLKIIQKGNISLHDDKMLKSKNTNRRHTMAIKRNIIRTSISLKGSKTPAPKYGRSLYVSDFIEEDIENQSVTPSKNNTVSVCTPRIGRVFSTPQSISRNTEEKSFRFLQYQQINLKFGDCSNPCKSLEIDKKNSDAVSDSVDEEQSPDRSPINSFTLTLDDSGENILLEDVTDPGLVGDDGVRNSSEYRELNVLGEIGQNNLSSRKSGQRLGKKSVSEDEILKMNKSEVIQATPLNIRVTRNSVSATPSEKKLHFGHLTNRSTPKCSQKPASANVSFASFLTKTPTRSILKKTENEKHALSSSRSRRSNKTTLTLRDDPYSGNPIMKTVATRNSKSKSFQSPRMQNKIGRALNRQASKSLIPFHDIYSEKTSYSPTLKIDKFVTQRKTSRITNASNCPPNLPNDDVDVEILTESLVSSNSDGGADELTGINDTLGVKILKSPDFASDRDNMNNKVDLSDHCENSLDEEDLFEPSIEKSLEEIRGVKRTKHGSKSLGNTKTRKVKKVKRARSDVIGVRTCNIFDVNKSDVAEEEGTGELLNISEVSGKPSIKLSDLEGIQELLDLSCKDANADDTNNSFDVQEANESIIAQETGKTPQKDLREVRSSSRLFKTPQAEEFFTSGLKVGRSSSKSFTTPQAEDLRIGRSSKKSFTTPQVEKSFESNSRSGSKSFRTPPSEIACDSDLKVGRRSKKSFTTPQVEKSENDWREITSNRLLETPKVKESPPDDSRTVRSSIQLFGTPKVDIFLEKDLEHVVGAEKVLKTPKTIENSPLKDSIIEDNSDEIMASTLKLGTSLVKDLKETEEMIEIPKSQEASRNNASSGVQGAEKMYNDNQKRRRSPKNDLSNIVGVKKMFATPKSQKLPKNDLSDVRGVRRMLETPKEQKSPLNDLREVRGIKKIMATPKIQKLPDNDLSDLRGVKELLGTQKKIKQPTNDLSNILGVKKMFSTPKPQKSPKNDLTCIAGVKRILATPKQQRCPLNDLTDVRGVKKVMATPRTQKLPENDLSDLRGVKKLLGSQKKQNLPKNDLSNVVGVKKMFTTPKEQKFPINDLTDVRGVKRLLKTPKQQKSPLNDLRNVRGVKKIMATRKVQEPLKNDLTDVSGVKELFRDQELDETSPEKVSTDIPAVNRNPSPDESVKTPTRSRRKQLNSGSSNIISKITENSHAHEHDSTDQPQETLANPSPSHHKEVDDNRDPFDILVDRKAIRTYKAKSVSPKVNNIQKNLDTDKQVTPSIIVEWVEDQNKRLSNEEHSDVSTRSITKHGNATGTSRGDSATPSTNKPTIRRTRRNKLAKTELPNSPFEDVKEVPNTRKRTRRNKEEAVMLDQKKPVEINCCFEDIKAVPKNESTPNVEKRPKRQTRRNKEEGQMLSHIEKIEEDISAITNVTPNDDSTANIQKRPTRQTRKNKAASLRSHQAETIIISSNTSDETETEPNDPPSLNSQQRPRRQTRRKKGGETLPPCPQGEIKTASNNDEMPKRILRSRKKAAGTSEAETIVKEPSFTTRTTGEDEKRTLVPEDRTIGDESKSLKTKGKRKLYNCDVSVEVDSMLTVQNSQEKREKSEDSKEMAVRRTRRNVNLPKMLEQFEVNLKTSPKPLKSNRGKRKVENETHPHVDDEPQIRRSKRTRK